MHRIAAKVIALRGTQNRMVCALLCALEIALNKTRPAMSSANSHSRRWLHVAAEGATLWEFHLQSGGVELKTCWKWCKGKKRAHSASEKGLIRKEKRLKWNVEKKILIRTPSIACLLKSSLSSSFSLCNPMKVCTLHQIFCTTPAMAVVTWSFARHATRRRFTLTPCLKFERQQKFSKCVETTAANALFQLSHECIWTL